MKSTEKKLKLAHNIAAILEILDCLENEEVNQLLVTVNPDEKGEGDYSFILGNDQTAITKIGLKRQLRKKLVILEEKYNDDKYINSDYETIEKAEPVSTPPPIPEDVKNAIHK